MQLKGLFTALITPFIEDELDEEGLRHLIRRQCAAGVTGIVLLGTTGETPTLSEEEQKRIIQIGVEEAKQKTLLIIGTGSNSTHTTLKKTVQAQELGADAALIVTPYYNKPTQEGIYQHYHTIATQTDLPLIVYNIQGRTGVNIETNTLLKIAGLPHVVGVKECSGNFNQVADVIETICSKYPDFSVLSGDDGLALPMIALGATGLISVVSNLIPEEMIALVEASLAERITDARKIHEQLLPLFRLAFIETNPMPIKYAMTLQGLPAGSCRLPLCHLRKENQEKLRCLFKNYQGTVSEVDYAPRLL